MILVVIQFQLSSDYYVLSIYQIINYCEILVS